MGAEANRVQYHPAIAANEDGTESVSGPEEFDIDRLQSIRHTRALALNFMNEPVAQDGVYWSSETYRYGEPESVSRVMISIDPAVTTKRSSDFTGIAVVGYSPLTQQAVVHHAKAVKMSGLDLKARVVRLLDQFPRLRRF